MRTSDDPKENNIRVRVSNEMMAYLVSKAKKEDISVSEYIRRMVRDNMSSKSRSNVT